MRDESVAAPWNWVALELGGEPEVTKLVIEVTRVFELLRLPVCRYLLRLTNDPETAEDLTQEAFSPVV